MKWKALAILALALALSTSSTAVKWPSDDWSSDTWPRNAWPSNAWPSGVEPFYSLTFNDAAPYGIGQSGDVEDSGSTTVCTTHDGTATDASFNCEYTAGSPPEGDGSMRHDGSVSANSAWQSVFSNKTDIWVRFWLYVDNNADHTLPVFQARSGSGIPGGGYALRVRAASLGMQLLCDGVAGGIVASMYTDDTWKEYVLHMNIITGTMELYWGDDSFAVAKATCDENGDDSGTPIDGFRVLGSITTNEQRWDHIRIYDKDPR
jgi:hypothetical protein